MDAQGAHRHSDKDRFCSYLNHPEGCKMSEQLLKTLEKFSDFQAEYEGSIPFTRSISNFNGLARILQSHSDNHSDNQPEYRSNFCQCFQSGESRCCRGGAISSMHQPLLLFRILSCAITTALSACSSVFTEAR